MSTDMQEILVYLTAFFMAFLSFLVLMFCFRVFVWLYMESCCVPHDPGGPRLSHCCHSAPDYDRQGNIYTISDDQSLSPGAHRYADFFYLEPTSEEAARIRAQLEKDDKDLPSYEDVMRISTLTAAAEAANAQQAPPIVVPPYSELDPNPIPTVVVALAAPAPPPAGRSNISATESATSTASTAPSTSRAAAAATATVSVAMPTAEHSSV